MSLFLSLAHNFLEQKNFIRKFTNDLENRRECFVSLIFCFTNVIKSFFNHFIFYQTPNFCLTDHGRK